MSHQLRTLTADNGRQVWSLHAALKLVCRSPYSCVPPLQVVAIVEAECAAQESDNQQNAAYVVKQMCATLGEVQLLGIYQKLLFGMQDLWREGADPVVVDNACSALCQMVQALGEHLPLQELASVLCQHLPLKVRCCVGQAELQLYLGASQGTPH